MLILVKVAKIVFVFGMNPNFEYILPAEISPLKTEFAPKI